MLEHREASHCVQTHCRIITHNLVPFFRQVAQMGLVLVSEAWCMHSLLPRQLTKTYLQESSPHQ